MHYELPDGRIVRYWHMMEPEVLYKGSSCAFEIERGRVFTRKDIILGMGYDGAERRGFLKEYKKLKGIG